MVGTKSAKNSTEADFKKLVAAVTPLIPEWDRFWGLREMAKERGAKPESFLPTYLNKALDERSKSPSKEGKGAANRADMIKEYLAPDAADDRQRLVFFASMIAFDDTKRGKASIRIERRDSERFSAFIEATRGVSRETLDSVLDSTLSENEEVKGRTPLSSGIRLRKQEGEPCTLRVGDMTFREEHDIIESTGGKFTVFRTRVGLKTIRIRLPLTSFERVGPGELRLLVPEEQVREYAERLKSA